MNMPKGKGVYIWRHDNILGGDPTLIADALADADVDFVCIKIHDGMYIYPGLQQVISAIRGKGIAVGGWGYVYLEYNAAVEAQTAVEACSIYDVEFYLLDAEAHAKDHFIEADIFADNLRLSIPVGMNSYWMPDLHRELPWAQLRRVSDFDCPQVYWRGSQPVEKLHQSIEAFSLMDPVLPMPMVAGDMYSEHGIKPTPEQVIAFLEEAKRLPSVDAVVMWSMDQMKHVPELWNAFSNFDWHGMDEPLVDAVVDVSILIDEGFDSIYADSDEIVQVYEHAARSGSVPKHDLHPIVEAAIRFLVGIKTETTSAPLYAAVVNTPLGLRVRSGPSLNDAILYSAPRGTRMNVWSLEYSDGYMWAKIDDSQWVASEYLSKV